MAAKRKCKFDIHQVTTFCSDYEAIPEESLSESLLHVKHDELEKRWGKLQESYEAFIMDEKSEVSDDFKDGISIQYAAVCEVYQNIKARIIETMGKLTLNQSAHNQMETTITQQPRSGLKLPPCEMPSFEGGYTKWPEFRDMFLSLVSRNREISPVEKLQYLRSKVRGEAYQIVKRFDLVGQNFDLAWEALRNRFENPRILVHQQIKQLFTIQAAPSETSKSIRTILDTIDEKIAILETCKINVSSWDPILVYICSSKLPEDTLRSWENSLQNHKELPTWKDMSKFLKGRIEMLETVFDIRKPNWRETTSSRPQAFHSQTDLNKVKYNCKKCNQNHSLKLCKEFKELPIADRIKFVFSNKYCTNCLSPSHFKSKCPSKGLCFHCQKKHHTLLHRDEETSHNSQGTSSPKIINKSDKNIKTSSYSTQTVFPDTSHRHLVPHGRTTVLPTALVYIKKAGDLFIARALLDAGSEKSFISTKIQQKLALPVENYHTKISGLGGTVVGSSKGICTLTLKSRVSNFTISLKAIIVPKLTQFLPSSPVCSTHSSQFESIDLADPSFYKPGSIDLIIGSDYLPAINLNGIKTNIGDTLEARESHFGWYLSGPAPSQEYNSFSTMVSPMEEIPLHELLKKFWELEEVEREPMESPQETYCDQFYQNTVQRQPEGRYVVRLPFKENYPDEIFLGASRNTAYAQYLQMEKRLDKTPELKDQYHKVLQEYIDLGHMEPVTTPEPVAEKQLSFFLPHHAVIKPESKSTKVRVVFNASKKTSSGFSLNDVLYQGPTLQGDLMQIILSWRYYKYVFTGDIQKMYRQILVHKADRPYQKILFRPKPDEAIKSFQLKTVTFGVNCAPYLAIRTLLELGENSKALYPLAYLVLKEETYVDDILSGGHDIEETKEKQRQLSNALSSAGFPLKKIAANHKLLLEHIAREDLLEEDFLKLESSSTSKTLGIRWNAKKDNFYYVIDQTDNLPPTTKRQILSVIARLFDPLGWLGPIVVVAKLIMQELWECKIDWDEDIPAKILEKWNLFYNQLPQISEIKIARWVQYSPPYQNQIHGFCDSSEKAYCGAVYLRVKNPNGRIFSNLLVAKTKVAPLKRTTIPKLELCGALLLAKLIKSLTSRLRCPCEIFLHTDSSIVLGWLQKSPKTLKTFVANRVTQILNITELSQWRYVKTDENPADLGTRGCPPQELAENNLWWHGPPWILQSKDHWPKPRAFDPVELETKKVLNFHLESNCKDILDEFSSFPKALRILSYRFRFINRILKRPFETQPYITAAEIQFVKNRVIKLAQKTHYHREYKCLQTQQPISRKSHILTLSPFLGQDGLLRVGGRLNNSGLSFNEKHPIIVPNKSRLATLIIEYTHKILLHAEHHLMLRAIRQGYHIPRIKNLIRKCIRNCKTCTIYKHRLQQQIMGALPRERVNFSLPFTYTGVDFAGPFTLKSSNLRNAKLIKGYAAVFVCFSTRAIHLEVCSELTTDAFLACFSRFTGRRGLPKTMFSDNGRNFLGAKAALLRAHNEFLRNTEKSLIEKYSTHGFTWMFIPPYAPHMGGLWEAAVKSMKSHLKKVAGNTTFTFEEFSTLLVRIEAILNSRPISPLSENPSELLPLTPGHFLRGAALIAAPETFPETSLENISFIKRWDRLKAIQQVFARRWKNEYITELQRRNKWKTEKDNLKENDFVLVKDDLLPVTEWRLGRIKKVICGRDAKVRMLNKPRCQLCRRNHPLKYCEVFRNMSPRQRRDHAAANDYCLNCFAQCHTRYWCESENRCKVCGYKHHTMIHEDGREVARDSSSFEEDKIQANAIAISIPTPSGNPERCLIPPLILVKLSYQGATSLVTFLLQPSTQRNFLLEEAANEYANFPTKGLRSASGKERFQVSSAHSQGKMVYTWELEIRQQACFTFPPSITDPALQSHFEYLQPKAHPQFATCRKVDGVIGYALMSQFLKKEYDRKEPSVPRAQNSTFGWIIHGEWKGCSCHQ